MGVNLEYFEKLKQVKQECYRYANLDIEDFVRQSLLIGDFDIGMMNNVNFNNIAIYPGSFGCYKTDKGIVAYFVSERGEKMEQLYTDPAEFMTMFIRSAPMCEKDTYSKSI